MIVLDPLGSVCEEGRNRVESVLEHLKTCEECQHGIDALVDDLHRAVPFASAFLRKETIHNFITKGVSHAGNSPESPKAG